MQYNRLFSILPLLNCLQLLYKPADLLGFCPHFGNYPSLFILYFPSIFLLLSFYSPSTNSILFLQIPAIYSQRGNILSPVWEYFVPNVGIIFTLNGNVDSHLNAKSRL